MSRKHRSSNISKERSSCRKDEREIDSTSSKEDSSSLSESTSSSSVVKKKQCKRYIKRLEPAPQNRVQKKPPGVSRHIQTDPVRRLNPRNLVKKMLQMKAPPKSSPIDQATQTEDGYQMYYPSLPTILEEEETESVPSSAAEDSPQPRSRHVSRKTFRVPTRRSERLIEKRRRKLIQDQLEYYTRIWSTEDFFDYL